VGKCRTGISGIVDAILACLMQAGATTDRMNEKLEIIRERI